MDLDALWGILRIVAACLVAAAVSRLILKKSITFKILFISIIPILCTAIVSMLSGAGTDVNLMWVYVLWVGSIIAYVYIIYRVVKKPLSDITEVINALSEGDTSIEVDKKALKGEHEIAHVNRQVVKLLHSLKKNEEFATQIGSGDLTTEYTPQGDHDTLGKAMFAMRSNLIKVEEETKKRKIEDENRNWGTQGLAKFAEILRSNNDDLETLSFNIISNLVKYLGANQGGIFVLNETDTEKILEMKACYAYDRKKFDQQTIMPGEGLVGACYLEGETIYMTDVPDEYLNITSGLGDSNPRAILVCPLKVNDEVYGVVEIASFEKFERHQLEFVEKVSESIASTISSVQVHIRTEKLLAQTKLQAEEMSNQEEELRQNMEEMLATQEEMRKARDKESSVQCEMRQFQDAIYATHNIIEYDGKGVCTDINRNNCDLTGVDRSFFVGKHVSYWLDKEVYEKLWSDLLQGKTHEFTSLVDNDGKQVTLKQTFMPILDVDGKLSRIVEMDAIDHTDEIRRLKAELEQIKLKT